MAAWVARQSSLSRKPRTSVTPSAMPPSMVATRGPKDQHLYTPYVAFYDHTLKTLGNTALTNHMGLESVMVHNWDGRMRFLRNDNQDDPFEGWKVNRGTRFKQMKPYYLAIFIAITLVTYVPAFSTWLPTLITGHVVL